MKVASITVMATTQGFTAGTGGGPGTLRARAGDIGFVGEDGSVHVHAGAQHNPFRQLVEHDLDGECAAPL